MRFLSRTITALWAGSQESTGFCSKGSPRACSPLSAPAFSPGAMLMNKNDSEIVIATREPVSEQNDRIELIDSQGTPIHGRKCNRRNRPVRRPGASTGFLGCMNGAHAVQRGLLPNHGRQALLFSFFRFRCTGSDSPSTGCKSVIIKSTPENHRGDKFRPVVHQDRFFLFDSQPTRPNRRESYHPRPGSAGTPTYVVTPAGSVPACMNEEALEQKSKKKKRKRCTRHSSALTTVWTGDRPSQTER